MDTVSVEQLKEEMARLRRENARLQALEAERQQAQEQSRRQFERITALRAIDVAILTSLDLRITLGVVLDQVTNLLGVHAAAIGLRDPHTQRFEYVAGRGFCTQDIAGSRLSLKEEDVERILLDQRLLDMSDLGEGGAAFARADLMASEGFTEYYAVPLIAMGEVKGILEVFHREPLTPDAEWLEFLGTLAGQASIAIESVSLLEDLKRAHTELIHSYDNTLEGWVSALDLRDKETEGHTQRVTEMTLRLARMMGCTDDELAHIRRGALLHDIGKIGVPDHILLKPGALTDEEWVVMRKHPVYAYEWLYRVSFLRPALDIPCCHHEKWDGSGYPHELKGEQIPLAARIFAVVDVWDALRSDRPYRKGWPAEKVREHIRSLAGTHFDPQVVEVFLQMALEEEVSISPRHDDRAA